MAIRNLMTGLLRKFVKRVYKTKITFNNELSKTYIILEQEYGHQISKISKESVDKNNDPIPWFTYPAIDYLNQLDISDMNCLEWGCGNSTIYFSEIVNHLVSVEDNIDWYKTVKNKLKLKNIQNVSLVLACDKDNYVNPKTNKLFDIIIIDGNYRLDCIKSAEKLFSGKGFIVLDNSNRYHEYCKELSNLGFLQVDFIGFGPIVEFTTQTSFFFKTNGNCSLQVKGKLPLLGNPNNF